MELNQQMPIAGVERLLEAVFGPRCGGCHEPHTNATLNRGDLCDGCIEHLETYGRLRCDRRPPSPRCNKR